KIIITSSFYKSGIIKISNTLPALNIHAYADLEGILYKMFRYLTDFDVFLLLDVNEPYRCQ
ncbi:MAG: hypothetical protein ABIA63_10745, partial [bacterium]